MIRRLATSAALLSAGLLLAPASDTLATTRHRGHSSGHHAVTAAAPQGQIACTQLGCERIPVSCAPVPGRTWRGTPTGYDVIVCPPR
jgi:hypothetical protein